MTIRKLLSMSLLCLKFMGKSFVMVIQLGGFFSDQPSPAKKNLGLIKMGRKRKGNVAEKILIDQLFELPTPERFQRAEGNFTQTGTTRSQRRYQMKDDNLGRLVIRKTITEQQFAAL